MNNEEASARIDRIFEQAVDIPAEDWSKFLGEQCGHDLELRNALEHRLKAYQRVAKDTEFLQPVSQTMSRVNL